LGKVLVFEGKGWELVLILSRTVKMKYYLLVFSCLMWGRFLAAPADSIPEGIRRLQQAYPQFIAKVGRNSVSLKDGTTYVYDDGKKNKTFQELLDNPDLEDMFRYAYPRTFSEKGPKKGEDPGRIRFMPFLMKMYGNSQEDVQAKLREVVWLPKTLNVKLQVTTVNGVADKMEAISRELDEIPELKTYLENPAGTFVWRRIAGTKRLSMHSFGMTIDINVKQSHYWQWDCKCANEDAKLSYKNLIPRKIVEVFEKHGFIWGGKWYHYDTMHFEYRPELLGRP
jgi:peptidoglycan LD-endopeptidase CwlK